MEKLFNVSIIIYLCILVFIGWIVSKKIKTFEDYFLAGRNLGLAVTTATCLATWAGAGVVMGFSGYLFEGGYSMFWIAIPTSIGVYAFAFLLSRKISNLRLFTLPDILEKRYSKTAKWIGAFFILINMVGLTAANFMAAGRILQTVSGWSFNLCMILAAIVIVLYTMRGGLKAVAWIDFFQWIILTVGIIMAIPLIFRNIGGWNVLHQKIAQESPWMMSAAPGNVFDIKTIISFFLVFTLPFLIDPPTYQRMYAAKNTRVARLAVTFTGLFDGFLTLGAIVIAFAAVILFGNVEGFQADMSFPMVVKEIIPGFFGVFILIALIAAVMSSADSYLLVSSGAIAQDYYMSISKNPQSGKAKSIAIASIPILAFSALILAWQFEYILDACVFAFSVFVSGACLPIIGAFCFKRGTNEGAISSMISGGTICVIWKILGEPFGIDPVLVGVGLSILCYFGVSFITKRPDPDKLKIFMDAT